MIKAVFFDIDGTLVSFATHRIPDSTMQAIDRLKSKGIKVFIATGRSELLIDNLDLDLFDGVITFNGQYCRDRAGNVIYKNAMPASDVEGALEYIGQTGIPCLFEGADFMVINASNDNEKRSSAMLNLKLPPVSDLSEIAGRDIIQLIFYGSLEEEKELLATMPSCQSTRWTSLLCDVIPKGGGKHIGIEKVLEYYGLTREQSMAFGDGENDISMLRYAGTGIAMGNASDTVKQAADYITDTVDEDGIAKALQHFLVIG
jgi:Cof subfamily protein (haloacid dehalogenase superfamily)